MPTVQLDTSIERKEFGQFKFPLGVYPVEQVTPRAGYVLAFEAADGGDADAPHDASTPPPSFAADPEGPIAGDWEEWPDRFMFDILISADKLPALVRALLSLLPGRLYPILDVLGNDAYREIDPYIAYDLVSSERFYDGFIQFQDWLLEDGLVGFGAMSMDPFIYLFVDEHKAVTVRVGLETKDELIRLLEAFDLTEVPEILGADAVAHEHRGVLARTNRPEEGLHAEEVVERLRDPWMLQLNIDTTTNQDDDGNLLGVTGFRAVVRCYAREDGPPAYAEVLLAASCHENAESLAVEAATPPPATAVEPDDATRPDPTTPTTPEPSNPAHGASPPNAPTDGAGWLDVQPLFCDRFKPNDFARYLKDAGVAESPGNMDTERVFGVRWFDAQR